ncbi:MAG TPA: gamma-glutamylcyclotransferase family protein [Holophagaceae bacterium]|nr:gamma-glutamylcyclotransferase family protein [Holophagaceae bacterium]
MQADGLFVYGPLREGGAHHRWVARTHPEGTCRAFAPGRLFHMPEVGQPALVPGDIPGALPPGPGWVVGDFIGYDDEDALQRALADLDALASEAGAEARLLPVLLEGGATFVAWTWAFHMEHLPRLEQEATEIPGGDWGPWL